MQQYQHIFQPTGYCYSVFGGMIEGIPELKRYLVVLMVRDPRDVLVSEYYSIAISHPEPDENSSKYNDFMGKRKFAREVSIDEYVVAECEKVYAIYDRYIKLLLDVFSHVHVAKYEDMISDFKKWITSLIDYCEFEIQEEFLNTLLNKNLHLRPKNEDINKHLRRGRSGDYKEKLKRETIDYLNSKFALILNKFSYI
jgi:hypothetical protein